MDSQIVAAQLQPMTFSEQMQYANTVCRGSLVPRAYRAQPQIVFVDSDVEVK